MNIVFNCRRFHLNRTYYITYKDRKDQEIYEHEMIKFVLFDLGGHEAIEYLEL